MSVGALAVAGATLCWGLDNNATGKVSAKDPLAIVRLKGLVAGSVNVGIALAAGSSWPSLGATAAALAVGGLTVGASLVCFILALREIGAARTTALFGTAPFIGTGLAALLFADSRTWVLAPAALAAGLGIWLLLTERHAHVHTHAPLTHEHRHIHDEHHQHAHAGPVRAPHSHVHTHEVLDAQPCPCGGFAPPPLGSPLLVRQIWRPLFSEGTGVPAMTAPAAPVPGP